MQITNRVFVEKSVEVIPEGNQPNERLAFEKAIYLYEPGGARTGFRFMWKIDGKHRAHRGQARIPSKKVLLDLIEKAEKAGLFD